MNVLRICTLLVLFSFNVELQARICINESEHYKRLGFTATNNLGSADNNNIRRSRFSFGRSATSGSAELRHRRTTQRITGIITNFTIGDNVFELGQPPTAFILDNITGVRTSGTLVIAPVIITIDRRKFGLLLDTRSPCNTAMKAMYDVLLDAYKNKQSISIRTTQIKFFDVPFDSESNAGEVVRGDFTHPGGLIYAVDNIPHNPSPASPKPIN